MTIKKILELLTPKERRQVVWLSLAIITMALIEVAGVASIMPFMAVVGNSEIIQTNKYLNWCYVYGGFSSPQYFLVFLASFVLFIILVSNVIKALTTYAELKFVNFRTYSLSKRLFFNYLHQPYIFFLNQNTAIMGKNILQEVFTFIQSVLKPATEIFSKLVVIIFVFGLLLLVDPVLALIILSSLGSAYAILYRFVQKKITRLGEERFEANAHRFRIATEALGGIKDLKILGRENYFYDRFSYYAKKMARNMVTHQMVSQLPRFVMEVMSFGGILIIIMYVLLVKRDVGQTLPILALYAFAGYRLMPALQGIFSSLTTMSFNLAALDAIHRDMTLHVVSAPSQIKENSELTGIAFNKNIQFDAVTFTYPGVEDPVIKNLCLTIEKNTSVGFVGATGSGKTTTVDIILGLLTPQSGQLKVDSVPITDANLQHWQRHIGYVPQTIFLSDDTLANNIAFGLPPEAIDMSEVERAARIANLHDFVVRELPRGYDTAIGERGVRLSGGQRQRIGIARALYHDPSVLIMDEATSALDGITEEAVIQAIQNLAGKMTIVTIAHRLTTLRDCDVIYVMDGGRVLEHGSYSELINTSDRFKAMARIELKS